MTSTVLGVVGCGDVAFSVYLPWLATQTDRAPVAVCFDIQPERAERAAALFPDAAAVTDLADVLAWSGLDAIVNLTPAPFHRDINQAALEAGLDVYTEKPLAGSLAAGQELTALAERLGRRLLCAPGIMTTARFRWLKDMLQRGELGRPTLLTCQIAGLGPAAWRTYSGDPAVFYREGVGPLIDTGIYLLHAVTGLIGPAKRVQAFGGIAIPERTALTQNRFGERIPVQTNDHMLIHLDFGGNRFAQILSSYATPASNAPVFELHGTSGSVSISPRQWYTIADPISFWQIDERPEGTAQWTTSAPTDVDPSLDILTSGLTHFLNVRAGTEAPILTAEHGCHVLEIIELAFRSAREGSALPTTTTI